MAVGEVLHRLGSLIGLYPDHRDSGGYGDGYDADEGQYGYEAAPRANGGAYRQTASSARQNYGSNYSAGYASSYGTGGTGGTANRTASARRPGYDEEEPARSGNVVPLRPKSEPEPAAPSAARETPQPTNFLKANIVYVRRKEDAQGIITKVLEGSAVVLNCEVIDDALCQRMIDILAGAAFAINGKLMRVSNRNYIFGPSTMEITSGEEPMAKARFGA